MLAVVCVQRAVCRRGQASGRMWRSKQRAHAPFAMLPASDEMLATHLVVPARGGHAGVAGRVRAHDQAALLMLGRACGCSHRGGPPAGGELLHLLLGQHVVCRGELNLVFLSRR